MGYAFSKQSLMLLETGTTKDENRFKSPGDKNSSIFAPRRERRHLPAMAYPLDNQLDTITLHTQSLALPQSCHSEEQSDEESGAGLS